jgi:hypothetical protein
VDVAARRSHRVRGGRRVARARWSVPHSVVTDEIKAAALADLANGEQPAVVAQRYQLSRDQVNKWKQRHIDKLSTSVSVGMSTAVSTDRALIRRPSIEEHQTNILELMYLNLEAKLTASQKLAEHVTSEEWLNRQSAEGVAALGQYLDATAAHTLVLLAGRRPDDSAT